MCCYEPLSGCGGYSVVYVHSPIAAALARISMRTIRGSQRPAVVYFAHGFHFLQAADRTPSQWLWYPLERVLARVTDRLIVLNSTGLRLSPSLADRS